VVAAALTPTAYAADGGVSSTPATSAPGSDIQLRATGCTGRTGVAKSDAFVSDTQLTGQDGTLGGETLVRTSLTPGTYDIKVSCDGQDDKVQGTVSVAQQGSAPSASVPASPVAPVHAGGGGTAHFASVDARETGPGTRQAVVGLVLASVAAAAVAVRSARRGHDTRD
jgi:hypothetical protein